MVRIGIDLGGTKIEGIALAADGSEVGRLRVATPRGDYDGTLAAIASLVESLERDAGRGSVGLGIPGTPSPLTGLIKNANSTWLIGRPLAYDLERLLDRPVRLANDANCFALSEATDGAAAGGPVVFGVILGTGCGGGVVVNGTVLTGPNGLAGEWGHNPLPAPQNDERPGPQCYCGKRGCLEVFLSGPALERDYVDAGGDRIDAASIAARAEREPRADAVMARYEARLARALTSVINLLDPDVIVLGGGLSNIDELYTRGRAAVARYIFNDELLTPIRRHQLGDSAGVIGAALLT